jgi:hypothetical protein
MRSTVSCSSLPRLANGSGFRSKPNILLSGSFLDASVDFVYQLQLLFADGEQPAEDVVVAFPLRPRRSIFALTSGLTAMVVLFITVI